MPDAPDTTRKTAFASVKGKEHVSKEKAEQMMKKKYERKTSTTNQKRTFGQTNKTKAQLRRETHAAQMILGPVVAAVDDAPMDPKELEEMNALEAYLRRISPFNGRWNILSKLKGGTFGMAFKVQDNETDTIAVVKVERVSANNINQNFAEWESFVLEKMFKVDQYANVVRLLDKGMLRDDDGNNLEFAAIEFCHLPVRQYINNNCGPNDRKYRVLRVALGSLKGLFDLHKQGILHRDVKPDNMGMIKQGEDYVCVLYDLGMARMYTDGDGYLRPPRTVVPFRGTPEWASGHAVKGREQTRFDDLIGWLYVIIELFDPYEGSNPEPAAPFPWDHCPTNKRAGAYLKSPYTPARLLLRYCPREFYTIHTYLMCANRLKGPDYMFIANLVGEAMNEFKQSAEVEKPKTKEEHRPQKKEGGKRAQQKLETIVEMNRDFTSLA